MEAFFINLAITLLLEALKPTPKLPKPQRYTLTDIQVPTATEDRAPVYIAGTAEVAGNCIWTGDFGTQEVKRRVRVSLFEKVDQVIGYRYQVGQWQTLSSLPIDELVYMKVGTRKVYETPTEISKTEPTEITVNKTWTTSEGQEVAEGLKGRLRFFNYDDRTVADFPDDPYLAAQIEPNHPAYPGFCHFVWLGASAEQQGFVSISPNIEPWTFCVKRLPVPDAVKDRTRATDEAYQWRDINGDANPAYVLFELLTSSSAALATPRFDPAFNVDLSSFVGAAGRLYSEGLGVSFVLDGSQTLGEVVEQLLRLVQGTLEVDPFGRLSLRLLRADNPIGYLFNASNITELGTLSRVALHTVPNEITVPFADRNFSFEARVATAQNLAAFSFAGYQISQERRFLGVSNARTAQLLANRELRNLSTSLARLSFKAVVDSGQPLKVGHLVLVEHPTLGQALRMRITTLKLGDYGSRYEAEIEAVEDIFRDATSAGFVEVPPDFAQEAEPPQSAVNPLLIPAPYALHGSDTDRLLYAADSTGLFTRKLLPAFQEGYDAWQEKTGAFDLLANQYIITDYTQFGARTVKAAISGALTQPLPALALQTPGTLTVSLTETAAKLFAVNGVREDLFFLIGDEWFVAGTAAIQQGTTSLVLGEVSRAVFHSVPRTHSAGAVVRLLCGYFLCDSAIRTATTDQGGYTAGYDKAVFRAESEGSGGRLEADQAVSSQAVFSFNAAASLARKPLPPAGIKCDGVFGSTDAGNPAALESAGDLHFSWFNRSRLERQLFPYYETTQSTLESTQRLSFVVRARTNGVWQTLYTGEAGGAQTDALTLLSQNIPAGTDCVALALTPRQDFQAGTLTGQGVEVYWALPPQTV